jgi:subtilisin family serine protease
MKKHISFALITLVALCGFSFSPLPAEAAGANGPPPIDFEHVPGEVLVKFKDGVPALERANVHAQIETKVVSSIPRIDVQLVRGRRGQSAEALMEVYAKHPNVEYVEPNGIITLNQTPNDPRYGDLWALHNDGSSGGTVDADIDAPEAWDLQIGSLSIVIASIDSGVDYTHEDLAANIWTNPGEIPDNSIDDDSNGYVDDYYGFNFHYDVNDPLDGYGHGTHTAGSMAAVGDNGLGITGINWQAKIMSLKATNDNGDGSIAAFAEALVYAVDMGAPLSNNSWGTGTPFSQVVEDALIYADANNHLAIFAAGNQSNDVDVSGYYPCDSTMPNVICVANTNHNDELHELVGGVGSNYGFVSVDLSAPGASILSTVPPGNFLDSNDGIPDDGYGYGSGTSMAAPHVAGVAALILAEYPSSTPSEVIARLKGSVDLVPWLAGYVATGGRLNAHNALTAEFVVAGSPATQTIAMGSFAPYTMIVSSLETFSAPVTLSMTTSDPSISASFDVNPITPGAGGSANAMMTIDVDPVSTKGTHALVVEATDGQETRSSVLMLEVTGPDYTVSIDPTLQYIGAGDDAVSTVTVTAFDGYSGPVTLSLDTGEPNLTGVFAPFTVNVPVDGTVPSALTISAAPSTAIGTYPVMVEGDDGSRTRSTAATVGVTEVDLVVTDITLPPADPLEFNTNYTFYITVKNQGTEDAGNDFGVSLSLSTDATLAGFVTGICSTPIYGGLAAGASTEVGCYGDIFSHPNDPLDVGSYYVVANADSGAGGEQPENDEDNNTLAAAVEVDTLVDLTMTEVSTLATQVSPGDSFDITNTIANLGTNTTTNSSYEKLYLSTDNVITTSDIQIGFRWISNFAGGASSTEDTTVTVPMGTAAGLYYFGAIADASDSQPETDETNNTLLAGTTITVVNPPNPLEVVWSDGFESGDFAAGGWTEDTASVTSAAAQAGAYGAKLKKVAWIEKAFDTTGFTDVSVNYHRQTSGYDGGENLYVEWYDGGGWNSLETIQSASYGDGQQSVACGAGADDNANFRIRFRTNANRNNELTYVDGVEIVARAVSAGPDTTPPNPDPMTWATVPYSTGSTSISMTATTATDASGVEYYFTCTAGACSDSGWQDSATYEDTGLQPDTQYTYAVVARDKSANQNETAQSSAQAATTDSVDTTAPNPDPMTWSTVPYATGSTSISMTATTATDPSGVEYYFTCTAGACNDSGWQDSATYEDTGLQPDTQYIYTAKARDKSVNQNETGTSTAESATTDAGGGPTVLWSDGFESGDWSGGGWQWGNTDASVANKASNTGSYGAKLKKTTYIRKFHSTVGYTNIEVRYSRETNSFDAGEVLDVEWWDGSNWNSLESVQSASYGDGVQVKSCGAGADNLSVFGIRFITNADKKNESAYVDDVEIVGSP